MIHLVHFIRLSASLHKPYDHVRNSNVQQDEYIFGATLTAIIICCRETVRHICKTLKLIDKILLVTPDAYKRSTLVITAEILVVFCVAGVIHAFELQDRHLGYVVT